jgi:ABC-2 type transport system permease protein
MSAAPNRPPTAVLPLDGIAPLPAQAPLSALRHEWRLLIRSRWAVAALCLLLALSAVAVVSGLHEVQRQQATITRVGELQRQELARQAPQLTHRGDAGTVAYYAFLGTWDPPSPAAFLAQGLRDVTPHVLRVRALALQSQLHEGETSNPELTLAGRFDMAFVAVYLLPLFLIALLYDLASSERQSGRLRMLVALPGAGRRFWLRRAGLRAGLATLCALLPVAAGAAASGMPAGALAGVVAAVLAYVACWSGLALTVALRGGSSVANSTTLMGAWAVLTLVLPTLGGAVLARAVPVSQGVEVMLAQRQVVHGAWDLPREETLARFLQSHPQWQHTAPLPAGFHWKWYYAFQQLGDESVAPQVAAYREALVARQRATEALGFALPGVGLQAVLHRIAGTDLLAQLAYQDAVATFHARLRAFYYPYLFDERRFDADDFARLPRFEPSPPSASLPLVPLLALALLGALLLSLGVRAAGRVGGR